ncbi:uncharacterized protein PGTG_22463 [Puccinia graminis f. sp. tritici CRL 75-36-700-3]|uniref:Uncharacterized protein n=1 Tax=Puccinia graminis f. sp. tritici (strain CRL 75-36-700-3 / race SCCL) TaxID=418459 RepID=H6QUR3_PUCGT|nr:uncharacterized protein PGTG_22463 [Puccinia graminis f. sp. tritici CRL 75-36-700-3]EHS64821.1 hypothetical protein PGTG_22463 [Puccinia graminis f. sp. tritici CRL 75-36-700-3]
MSSTLMSLRLVALGALEDFVDEVERDSRAQQWCGVTDESSAGIAQREIGDDE